MVRIPAFPEAASLKSFKVFVSYRATQLAAADQLRNQLHKSDVAVSMIEPSQYEKYRTDDELLVSLREKVREADAICIVASEDLQPSEYVQAEINEAQRVLGRVIFVHDGTTRVTSHFMFQDPGPKRYKVGFVVKHTSVSVHSWDESTRRELLIEILNDPDEGWFARPDDIPDWWQSRDFHMESVLRKYVRMSLHVDQNAGGREIRDVMPLTTAWHYPQDPDEMFKWYARAFGRRNLVKTISDGECNGMVVRYLATQEGLVNHTTDGWLTALYLRTSSKKTAMTFSRSLGRYRVPAGEHCQWPECQSLANGSVGSNGDRIWLCMKHLEEMAQKAAEHNSESKE